MDVWARGLPKNTYVSLLAVLTVAELPLLALAFQNFFSVFFSLIVSVGVSVAIIFLAHAAGVLLAKREAVLHPGDTAILMSIFAGVVTTIIGLSFVRELYLETNERATGVQTGPTWVVVVVFAIFNIMVFGAAVLVAKLRHSEYAETVDDARMSVRRARREIKRARKDEKKWRKHVARIQHRIVLLDGLASSTAQRTQISGKQARLAAASRKDFIEKCYALYVRENTRSQAAWAARRARLSHPVESGPIPTFNRLPEVKDPDVEFGPFEEQVRKELQPLVQRLSHVQSITGTSELGSVSALNGNGAVVPHDFPHHAS